MKILVIHAHPSADRFSSSLAESYAESAIEQGATVEVLYLRELKFDACLDPSQVMELEPDLQRAQELIEWADHLVFATPMWWGSVPALLKGFIDRTFLPGFAYKYTSGPFPNRLLTSKTARVILTMDAPTWWDTLVNRGAASWTLRNSILKFCGFRPVKITKFGQIRRTRFGDRERMLDKVAQLARQDTATKLITGQPDLTGTHPGTMPSV